MHDMAKGILVLGPDDSTLDHRLWVIAHGLESGESGSSEGRVWIHIGMRRELYADSARRDFLIGA